MILYMVSLQAALGVTGVEGTFRSSCEAVLLSLRHNSRALLLLMEAILTDPLVDWAPDREDAVANQVGPSSQHPKRRCFRSDSECWKLALPHASGAGQTPPTLR